MWTRLALVSDTQSLASPTPRSPFGQALRLSQSFAIPTFTMDCCIERAKEASEREAACPPLVMTSASNPRSDPAHHQALRRPLCRCWWSPRNRYEQRVDSDVLLTTVPTSKLDASVKLARSSIHVRPTPDPIRCSLTSTWMPRTSRADSL